MLRALSLALVLVILGSAASSSAWAFDMPKPKKDKKDKAADTSTTTTTDNTKTTKTDDTKKTDGTAATPATKTDDTTKADTPPAAPAPTAPPAPAQVMEVKVAKSAWDKGGLDAGKPGDFVEYDYPAIAGYHVRMELIEKGDHTTTTLNVTTMAGNTTQAKMKMIYSEPDPVTGKTEEQAKADVKEAADKVTTKKGDINATRYETYDKGVLLAKAWISKDVPMGGMIKAEGPDGKVSMILTDYGRGK